MTWLGELFGGGSNRSNARAGHLWHTIRPADATLCPPHRKAVHPEGRDALVVSQLTHGGSGPHVRQGAEEGHLAANGGASGRGPRLGTTVPRLLLAVLSEQLHANSQGGTKHQFNLRKLGNLGVCMAEAGKGACVRRSKTHKLGLLPMVFIQVAAADPAAGQHDHWWDGIPPLTDEHGPQVLYPHATGGNLGVQGTGQAVNVRLGSAIHWGECKRM